MRQSQKQMILDYLRQWGEITPKEAEKYFGCMRLAARIAELRADGHHITREMLTERNRFGQMASFAVYRLKETEDE